MSKEKRTILNVTQSELVLINEALTEYLVWREDLGVLINSLRERTKTQIERMGD